MNSADQMSVYAEMEQKGLLTSDIVNNQSSVFMESCIIESTHGMNQSNNTF